MKTTAKQFIANTERKNELSQAIREQEDKIDNGGYDREKWSSMRAEKKALESNYFSKLETVNVSFSIGSRGYYESVVKIGKAYFNNGRKMTKSRGYYFITEIEEINEEMKREMMSDSYYY